MQLSNKAKIELVYQETPNTYLGEIDCRLLFLGENYKFLLEAYPKAVDLLRKQLSANELKKEFLQSELINKLYEICQNGDQLALKIYETILFQQGTTKQLPFYIKLSNGKNSSLVEISLEKLNLIGKFWPLAIKSKNYSDLQTILKNFFSGQELKFLMELAEQTNKLDILINPTKERKKIFYSPSEPRVFFLGHSSLLFQSGQQNILVDPILLFSHGLTTQAFEITQIKISAILCSHSHWDHCHFQSLMFFDKSIPIFIPKIKIPSGFNPPMISVLELLGFTSIKEVELWETTNIGEVEFIPIPFFGEEDEPNAVIDHFTYVIRVKDFSIYGGVDSYQDSFGNMLPILEKVKNLYHPDIAFLPVSKMVYNYEYGGVNGFCSYFDTNLFGKSFQYTADPTEASHWTQILETKFVVPYATFVFSRDVYQSNFLLFANALKNIGLGKKLCPLLPLDFISIRDLKENYIPFFLSRQIIKFWLICCMFYEYICNTLSKVKIYIAKKLN